jgi:U3 small nucleolar RNA-associated protein 5
VPTKRYAEPPSLKVGSGVELGRDEEMDEPPPHGIDGELDVGIAELSLGQRLAAMSGRNATQGDSDGEEAHSGARDKRHRLASTAASTLVPATSLTRTLIQALHSSDTRLLETCLAHSDIIIIKNTVRRLPPQLAIPLLTACMERLGRGARAGTMKGGGAGASSQRGKGLVGWVKAVLAFHSGHLITVRPFCLADLFTLVQ